MSSLRNISVGFVSLGCAKNLVDSEVMAHSLTAAGFKLAPAPERAGIVLINTCAFIRDAKEESIAAILEACAWKAAGRCRWVMVAGCLPQRYRRELARSFPEVDAFIGVDEAPRAGALAARLVDGTPRLIEISTHPAAVIDPPADRPLFTGAPFAYLKVADGCDHPCSFCVIPRIRGRYRSRRIGSIVAEAETLLSRGIRELNLVAQDVTFYGCDLGGDTDLAKLLRALGRIGGRFWIRLLYGHPRHVTGGLLAAMGEVAQVCHYLDLPIQHSHAQLLKTMGRGQTGDQLRRLFRKIRASLPEVTLRTTCLVGFPGETEDRFQNLLAFLEEIRFDHAGVFAFSPEENTPAARLARRVSARVAGERRARLLAAQQAIVDRRARALIGCTAEVLIESAAGKKPGAWIARARSQAPEVDGVVRLRGAGLAPGALVWARYTAAAGYDMRATVKD